MRVGEIFQRYGAYWMADTVTVEENQSFRWLKVVAKWSWLGPMPLWHTEDRTFLMNRTRRDTHVRTVSQYEGSS